MRRHRAWHSLLSRISILCVFLAGCAATAPAPGPVSSTTPLAWTTAIGALALKDDSRVCTAVLVRRDLIVSASHCLYPWDRALAPTELEFRPNWGASPPFAPLPVLALQAEGGAVLDGHIRASELLQDWIVLRITPAPAALQPLPVSHLTSRQIAGQLAAGGQFYSAGYGGGAKTSLRQHRDCRLLDPSEAGIPLPAGVLVSDCVIRLSDSGGPMVLIDATGKPQLIAIISGFKQRAGLPPVGFGVGAGSFAAAIDGMTLSLN